MALWEGAHQTAAVEEVRGQRRPQPGGVCLLHGYPFLPTLNLNPLSCAHKIHVDRCIHCIISRILDQKVSHHVFLDLRSRILKYMGDLPSRRSRASNELTDQIFEAPLKHVSKPRHSIVLGLAILRLVHLVSFTRFLIN